MPIDATLNKLSSTRYAQDVGFVAGGYAASAVSRNLIERFGPDLPDELYGVIGIALSTYALSGRDSRYLAAGAGLYTVDALGRRVGVKSAVMGLGR